MTLFLGFSFFANAEVNCMATHTFVNHKDIIRVSYWFNFKDNSASIEIEGVLMSKGRASLIDREVRSEYRRHGDHYFLTAPTVFSRPLESITELPLGNSIPLFNDSPEGIGIVISKFNDKAYSISFGSSFPSLYCSMSGSV